MYNHHKAQQSKNRVHISWDILYICIHICVWYNQYISSENAFENVVWQMAAILSRPQCVNWLMLCVSERAPPYCPNLARMFRPCESDEIRRSTFVSNLVFFSLSCKASYHQISWSIEAERLGVTMIVHVSLSGYCYYATDFLLCWVDSGNANMHVIGRRFIQILLL